jgi:TatA/E family protein of Tat protein translocase
MFFGRFGPLELGLVLAIALLIFGPKKIPEIGKAIGRTIKEFKKGSKGDEAEDRQAELSDEEKRQVGGERAQETSSASREAEKEQNPQ